MKLNFEEYKSKVYACWTGKNIGGTIGGPYEGKREILNVTGFTTKPGEALPNDDLDLQLVWLHAVESEGAKNITAEVLGEYWLSFISGYWNEYGIAHENMLRGIIPPLCGDFDNAWKHSNGAWIRTEIWATLAPGYPDLAVRFAMEDAKVDHGSGEGTYAAAFVAAIESAAFVVSDVNELIEIGLSKIPENCRMAQTVRLVIKCFNEGKTAIETRNIVQKANADIGDGWFQAPSNVGFVVIGLLYGEGDFKKSMLTALNCGDDTDCTAGTIGSIMGIIYGEKGLPKDWCEYIGDKIVTGTINPCIAFPSVKSCKELTERVCSLAPAVLRLNSTNALSVELCDETELSSDEKAKLPLPYGKAEETDGMRASLFLLKENAFSKKIGCITVVLTYESGLKITPNEEKTVSLKVINNVKAYGNLPHTARFKLWMPDGFTADKSSFDVFAPHWTPFTLDCVSDEVKIKIKAGEEIDALNEILIEASVNGRYTKEYISLVFIAAI